MAFITFQNSYNAYPRIFIHLPQVARQHCYKKKAAIRPCGTHALMNLVNTTLSQKYGDP